MAKITIEEIENIALLSKLYIKEDEIDELTGEMAKIIDFADTINSADGASKEFDNINDLSDVFREDEIRAPYPQSEILKNAHGGDRGFFRIKRTQE